MKQPVDCFEAAVESWRLNKGIGTAIMPPGFNDRLMILMVLQRIYARSPTTQTLIIVENFNDRTSITEFLTTQEDKNNNNEFKKLLENKSIKVLTKNLTDNADYRIWPHLTIVYRPIDLSPRTINILQISKFRLCILNGLNLSAEKRSILYGICPVLDEFKGIELNELRLQTPVEEYLMSVNIPDNTEVCKVLKYYNDFISTSIAIFGSFEIMNQARIGNNTLNISAAQICANIAQENGWNEHLDMSIELNRQVDELYNPANLSDRASKTYEIIRNRSQLLSDFEGKLEFIDGIVKNAEGKKILIISKRGEFASKVTEYLNAFSETIICGNYHDKVENVPAVDENDNPVFYKSGEHKGERKYMAAKMQMTINERKFNHGKLKVLSTSNAPNKDLRCKVDIVIITSPQCEDIESYIYRLNGLTFGETLTLYTIYCKNTLEENLLKRKTVSETHKIVNEQKNNVILGENSDYIIVD